MKRLPKTFVRGRVFYSMVKRIGNIGLYSLRYSRLGREIGYDVFITPKERERVLDGKTLQGGEGMPRKNAWGYSAWSYDSLEAADLKFKLLVEALDTKDLHHAR